MSRTAKKTSTFFFIAALCLLHLLGNNETEISDLHLMLFVDRSRTNSGPVGGVYRLFLIYNFKIHSHRQIKLHTFIYSYTKMLCSFKLMWMGCLFDVQNWVLNVKNWLWNCISGFLSLTPLFLFKIRLIFFMHWL